jgi:hypothetical protein
MKAGPTAVFPHEGTFTLPVHAHVRRTQRVETNRRPALPVEAGREFERASCAPPVLSAAVAHPCRLAV